MTVTRKYNARQRYVIQSALRKLGLKPGIRWLAANRGLKISTTLGYSVAKEFSIKLPGRGRPKKVQPKKRKKAVKASVKADAFEPPATPPMTHADEATAKENIVNSGLVTPEVVTLPFTPSDKQEAEQVVREILDGGTVALPTEATEAA